MSRVELAEIRALTFYKGEKTAYRRTSPYPQLICIGKPCSLYQPEVVRCTSLGGTGVDVDWKCEADLPGSLRFGKVEVNCEGWSGPGDPYVLKGSCSLEYRLVQVPGSLLQADTNPVFNKGYDWPSIGFYALWIGFLIVILYSFLKSCFGNADSGPRAPPRTGMGQNPRPSSDWFPGSYRDDRTNPPPPYTKHDQNSSPQGGWRPGFWTGAMIGGLANHVWNRNSNVERPAARRRSYDWERFRARAQPPFFGDGGAANSRQRRGEESDDRGEGSSNLGMVRRSTGIGGSKVR